MPAAAPAPERLEGAARGGRRRRRPARARPARNDAAGWESPCPCAISIVLW